MRVITLNDDAALIDYVIGARHGSRRVSARPTTTRPQGGKPKAEVVAEILASIRERRA